MKKVIILRKIHLTMTSLAPLFSTIGLHETKHVHASAANLLNTVLEYEISIGADITKTR